MAKISILLAVFITCFYIKFPELRPHVHCTPYTATSPIAWEADGDPSLGAVASESTICSAAGIEMLKKGGNAADAVSL